MHVSIFSYRIQDIDDADWSKACDALAPTFAAVPSGSMARVMGAVGSACGRTRLPMGLLASDLAKAVGSHPNIAELTMRDFAVDEAPTRVTRGMPTALG
jgi:hypothetical protein